MLEKFSKLSSVTVLETGELECKFSVGIVDDGIVQVSSDHFDVLSPGADISGKDARVQSIAAAVWTPASMAALTAEIVAQATQETAERNAAIDAARAKAAEAETIITEAEALYQQAMTRKEQAERAMKAALEAEAKVDDGAPV